MFGLGFQELVLIFLVVFLLFGAKSLPDFARGLGQAIRLFKKEMSNIKSEFDNSLKDDSPSKKPVETISEKNHSDDFKESSERRPWRKEIGSNV